MPTSYKTSESINTKEMIGSKANESSVISTTTARQESKPMSYISGVRRDLSRCGSVAQDVIHLPKYGVNTDRETDLGEVFKNIFILQL